MRTADERALCDDALYGRLGPVARALAQGVRAAPACFEALRHGVRHAGRRWDDADAAHRLVALLVAATGTPDPVDEEGFTPMLRAAQTGDLLTLGTWLDAGADANRRVAGQTALHLLAKASPEIPLFLNGLAQDVALRLVDGGCDPDAVAPDGMGHDAVRQRLRGGTGWDARMNAHRRARVLDGELPDAAPARRGARL